LDECCKQEYGISDDAARNIVKGAVVSRKTGSALPVLHLSGRPLDPIAGLPEPVLQEVLDATGEGETIPRLPEPRSKAPAVYLKKPTSVGVNALNRKQLKVILPYPNRHQKRLGLS
jgi:hypothetical protein